MYIPAELRSIRSIFIVCRASDISWTPRSEQYQRIRTPMNNVLKSWAIFAKNVSSRDDWKWWRNLDCGFLAPFRTTATPNRNASYTVWGCPWLMALIIYTKHMRNGMWTISLWDIPQVQFLNRWTYSARISAPELHHCENAFIRFLSICLSCFLSIRSFNF